MPRWYDSSSSPQVINSNTNRGSNVYASVLKATKTFLEPYNEQLHNETINNTRGHMASYKRFIQPKTYISIIGATKHKANCITIGTIALYTFPNLMHKLQYLL